LYLCPAWSFPPGRPFFGDDKAAIDKTFGQIQIAAVFHILDQRFEQGFKDTCLDPFLEAAMAGLVSRVTVRHINPRGARAHNP